jgi:hypothetical protein
MRKNNIKLAMVGRSFGKDWWRERGKRGDEE